MSICPHKTTNQYFIFCVGQDWFTIFRFKKAMRRQNIGVKELEGKYRGQEEVSFIANLKHWRDIEPWLREEQSYLLIHRFDARDRPDATLIFLKTGTRQELGKLYPVSRTIALAHDSYTYDPRYNCYYVTQR